MYFDEPEESRTNKPVGNCCKCGILGYCEINENKLICKSCLINDTDTKKPPLLFNSEYNEELLERYNKLYNQDNSGGYEYTGN